MASEAFLKKAEHLIETGEMDQASLLYEKVLKENPVCVDTMTKLGALLYQKGNISKAEALFDKASELTPQDASLFNNLGVMQYRQNRLEQARVNLQKAVVIDQQYRDAAVNLKRVCLDEIQNRIEKAFSDFSLNRFHYLTSYIYKLKTDYLMAKKVTYSTTALFQELNQIGSMQDDRKDILIIAMSPRVELAKMADTLKRTDKYRVWLLCAESTANIVDGFYKQHFHKIIGFSHLIELIHLLLSVHPDLIIARQKCHIAALAIIFGNSPVIYHMYDVVNFWYSKEHIVPLVAEGDQFSLMNADGILYKDSPDVIDKYLGPKFNISIPVVNFPPYCWEQYFAPEDTPKLSQGKKELHIVYTGQVQPTNTDVKIDRPIHFLNIAKVLTEQRLHFHIYYSPHLGRSDEYYKEYFELGEKNEYFHFHSGIGYKRLIHEIANYDYGWSVHDFRGTINSPLYIQNAIGNRIFTYMEAGLPSIVSSNLEYTCQFILKHGIGFIVDPYDLSNISEILKNTDLAESRKRVFKARQELTLSRHVHELDNFLNTVDLNREHI